MNDTRIFLIKNNVNNSYVIDIKMKDHLNSHRYYYLMFTPFNYELFYIKSINTFLRCIEKNTKGFIELSNKQKSDIYSSINTLDHCVISKELEKIKEYWKHDIFSNLLEYDLDIIEKVKTENNRKEFNK